MRSTCWSFSGAALLAAAAMAAAVPPVATAEGADAFDPFFRYAEPEHRAAYGGLPDETIDPFSGTLRIVQTDLVLPGKAGHDLRIVRAYSSKIWGDLNDTSIQSLLAEKEGSMLGYGWSFHMGRLKNPNASGQGGVCSGDYPVLELPDGSARVFYRISSAVPKLYASRDYWLLEQDCAALGGGGAGACVWSADGVRYEFPSTFANSYTYGGTTLVWPATGIVHPTGNRISVAYTQDRTGAIDGIIDTYGRTIAFEYAGTATSADGKRLVRMYVNNKTYTYEHTAYPTLAGGTRRFLTRVVPPAGPATRYGYATNAPPSQNQYALSSLTHANGATVAYDYVSVPFYAGFGPTVSFAVVASKAVTDRGGGSLGTWRYSYSAPQAGMNTTAILRPDGKADVYTMFGFGAVTSGGLWQVGLTQEVSRASGAEVETLAWDQRLASPIAEAIYSAPGYVACAGASPPVDNFVYAPALAQREVVRDGATYTTSFADWDAYGQPRRVDEVGQQRRTTTWTFFVAPRDASGATLNLVRGRPISQHVCVGSSCFDNSWTYRGPGYATDTETLAGVQTSFEHHRGDPEGAGNLASVTNMLGQVLGITGYAAGSGTPARLDFNGAFSITRTTSWEGWIISETNGRAYTTAYDYDAIGRPLQVAPPSPNLATDYAYAADNSTVRATRGLYVKETSLDGLGRPTGTVDSEGVRTSLRYDALGRALFRSYAWDLTGGEVGDRFFYDGLGRVLTQTKAYRPASARCDDASACQVSHSYSQNCVTTTVERSVGDTPSTVRCSTSFGDPEEVRLSRVAGADGAIWSYSYNGHGAVTGVAAPLAAAGRSYTYDPTTQFLTEQRSGESGTTRFERNAIGQMTSRRDARGVVTRYGHADPIGRLRSIDYQDGTAEDATFTYDGANNLLQMASDGGGQFDYAYDELNRMGRQTWLAPGSGTTPRQTYVTSYDYDAAGCLRSMTYPTGAVLNMTCDSANRVKTIRLGGQSIVSSVTYHPSGQVAAVSYGNGIITTVEHDDRGRALRVTAAGALGLVYAYDGADNVTSFDDTAVPGSPRTMSYDAVDRLVGATYPGQWSFGYGYDEAGNRTSKSGSAAASFEHDGSNRLATVTSSEPVRLMTFTWDAAGRLAGSSDGAGYRYDGRGRRVRKAEPGLTTYYHHDAAGRVIAETLADGTRLREYVYLGNQLVALSGCVEGPTTSTCEALHWYHTDRLGSVVARTDATRTVVARFDYQPFGERWTVPVEAGDRQYNGRVYDPGTGFHDYGARLYWPQIGRFVSADHAAPNLKNPASFNRYSYVYNNPYKYVDPDGHMPFLAVTGLIGAVGGGIYGAISSANSAEGFSVGAVVKWGAIGGLAGLTLGAGTSLALTGTVAASTTEVGAAGAALLGLGGTAAATKGQQAMTTLYHGGELAEGAVQSGRFSTTPVLEHAMQYAERSGGQVYRFDVPTRWLMEMEKSGGARRFQDLLKGATESALEWRFYGEAAAKMNEYLVPASSGATP
jgi:RHS repeat-associated protein